MTTHDGTLLIGTKKGGFLLDGDATRVRWTLRDPILLGHMVHHIVQDPRQPEVIVLAARTGHLGPTVFRSTDGGRSWKEASRPPAFTKVANGAGRVVNHVFWLTPGHPSTPGMWYAGTSPHGLFRSDDGGDTWEGLTGLNDDPQYREWMGGPQDGTPDGPKLHSIQVDPRDPTHLYLGMSSGGVHESLDGGQSWRPLVGGLEVVEDLDPANIQFHDPHCLRLCPTLPDRLYQQSHCGIYRLDRPSETWQRIGKRMPAEIGDIGFPIALHPRDPDTLWVLPMDGTDVWPRTSPGGKPAAYISRDGGASWTRQDRGLPAAQAWFTVLRQAMTTDNATPLGVYFGTTGGEIWGSADEGTTWQCLVRHLPPVYAVEAARSTG
jgi:hypothetical protein